MNLNYLEYAANGFYLVAVFLAARNSIYNWGFGVVGCALFALLFYQVNLYAEVALMLFFIATNLVGWYQWHRPTGSTVVTSVKLANLVSYAVAALVVTVVYGYILHNYTDAYAPFIDSAILMFSIIAQFLLMRRKLQTWWFWLVVNTLAIPLYVSRDLHITALVYTGFWFNAWYGWYLWRRLAKQHAT